MPSALPVHIRPFVPTDAPALATVYRDAVTTIGPQAYSPEQVAAWALYPDDLHEFTERLSRGLTLVAMRADKIVAFGQLEPDDHLAFLYTRGEVAREGIGAKIYHQLETHALSKGVEEIHTEASRISRGFFANQGYAVREIEHVVRFGIEFERFRMTKRLTESR